MTEQTRRTKDEAGPRPAHTHELRDRAACNASKGPRVDRPGVDGRTNDKGNRSLADQDTNIFNIYLIHVTREFHSVKLICRNLYAIFSQGKKAYTANQNGVPLFSHVSHVDVQPINDSVKAFTRESE